MERAGTSDAACSSTSPGRAEQRVELSTWSSLAPLALTGIPREIRERLANEHLLHPRRYRARFGVPSVSMEEPSFRPGFNAYRTWRGAAWMNTNVADGRRRCARSAPTTRPTRSRTGALDAVERSGFREYYHPRTGAGHGEQRFGFATLALDLPPGFAPLAPRVARAT